MASSILPETLYGHIHAVLQAAMPDILARETELFGDSEDCTDAEAEIIFNDRLTHREKIAALRSIRKGRRYE